MPKLSRYGALLKGALITHIGPRLAQDAKLPDFNGLLIGASTTNRVSQRAAIAQAVQTLVKPHLAQDAELDDVAELLEAIEKMGMGEEGEDMGTEPNSAIPMTMPDEEEGLDGSGAAEKIKMICEKHHLAPEICAELSEAVGEEEKADGGLDFWDRKAEDRRKRLGRDESEEERERAEESEGAQDARKRMGRDESEEEAMDRRAEDAARHAMRRARDGMRRMGKDAKAEDRKRADDAMKHARDMHRRAAEDRRKRAEDRKRADDKRRADDMVTRKDAEDMVKKAVDKRHAEDQALYEAREFVRPWVGELRIACDSAPAVYRETLKALGDAEAATLHESALRTVISRTPKPGDLPIGGRGLALDATLPASVKPASERFAGAGRVTIL